MYFYGDQVEDEHWTMVSRGENFLFFLLIYIYKIKYIIRPKNFHFSN